MALVINRVGEPVIVQMAREVLLAAGHSLAELSNMPASDILKLADKLGWHGRWTEEGEC